MIDTACKRPAYLSCLEYALGSLLPISRFDELSGSRSATTLRSLGYRNYSEFAGSLDELGSIPIAHVFESDPVLANKLDAVMIARQGAPINVVPLLRSHGVRDIPVLEIGGMHCATLAAAIAQAAMMVSASVCDTVLCCFAIKSSVLSERMISGGTGFMGDGAACCVVSAAIGNVEIRNFAMATSLELSGAGRRPNTPLVYLNLSMALYEQIMKARDRRRFQHLVSANFPFTNSLFTSKAGPACGVLTSDNVAKNAHIAGADILINFKDLLDTGAYGDCLLVGMAPYASCMIDVTVIQSSPDGRLSVDPGS